MQLTRLPHSATGLAGTGSPVGLIWVVDSRSDGRGRIHLRRPRCSPVTKIATADVEAPVVALLLRVVGVVLRSPLRAVKTTVCLMAVHGVRNDGDGGFPSSSSGDGPATSTNSLVHRFQIEEDTKVRNFVGDLVDKVRETGVDRDDGDNLRRPTMAAGDEIQSSSNLGSLAAEKLGVFGGGGVRGCWPFIPGVWEWRDKKSKQFRRFSGSSFARTRACSRWSSSRAGRPSIVDPEMGLAGCWAEAGLWLGQALGCWPVAG